MKICLITPAPTYSRKGNRVTALRWARILRELGHRVIIAEEYQGERCDVLVALHARRSHASIVRFRHEHPELPLILALTGTDLYGDIHTDASAQESLEMADRFILLQPAGIEELSEHLRDKAWIIYQSITAPPGKFSPKKNVFELCVLGHLRPVKDPFRTAMAARQLPPSSRIQVVHVGGALTDDMKTEADAEASTNPRYRWLGELPRWRALRILARSRVLVLTSQMEGGANAVSEAIACSVPVISSCISGSIGLLGEDYPGYFPVGDTQALTDLLMRVEMDTTFYSILKTWCERLKPIVDPDRERQSWKCLLQDLQ